VDLSATTTTHLDDDSPSDQWFCIHRQSASIAKPLPCSYFADVEDHQEESRFFFKPNVVYLPETMNFILKPLLHNDKLFNLHRKVLGETLLEVITSNNDAVLGSSNLLQTLDVESVAKQKSFQKFLIDYRSLAATSTNSIKSCPIEGHCK
jgi:hypothetical protein